MSNIILGSTQGKVGVGTAVPASPQDVTGDINTSTYLYSKDPNAPVCN